MFDVYFFVNDLFQFFAVAFHLVLYCFLYWQEKLSSIMYTYWVVFPANMKSSTVHDGRQRHRNLSTRLTERKPATRNWDVNNHIAEHHLQMKHQIDWDAATCIANSTDYYQRLTLES